MILYKRAYDEGVKAAMSAFKPVAAPKPAAKMPQTASYNANPNAVTPKLPRPAGPPGPASSGASTPTASPTTPAVADVKQAAFSKGFDDPKVKNTKGQISPDNGTYGLQSNLDSPHVDRRVSQAFNNLSTGPSDIYINAGNEDRAAQPTV